MSINEKLFSLLEEKNKTQADLARFLNIRTSVIGNWKTRGNNPPAELLAQICVFLDITINELLDIPRQELTQNDEEALKYLHMLPEREQIKWIGRLEDAANQYQITKQENII